MTTTTETLPSLTEEQEAALQKVIEFILDKTSPQRYLTLGGYAGVGKSFLISELFRRYFHGNIAIIAYTGKAVSVLRQKGIYAAQTIHSFIYHTEEDENGVRHFYKKRYIREKIAIVDEASMVSKEIHEDLLSFPGLKILYVGDHGQLEPIGADNFNLMKNPHIRLETIHRQAEGSNIIKFATAVRLGKTIRNGECDNVKITDKSFFWDEVKKNTYDTVICGYNKTRVQINHAIRKQQGIMVPEPQVGEKIICLRNNNIMGLYNGMLVNVLEIKHLNEYCYIARLEDELKQKYNNVIMLKEQFGQKNTLNIRQLPYNPLPKDENYPYERDTRRVDLFDYGGCLTAHKVQGSQFNSVLAIEEIWYEKWEPERWRYTVITRAKDYITYCR